MGKSLSSGPTPPPTPLTTTSGIDATKKIAKQYHQAVAQDYKQRLEAPDVSDSEREMLERKIAEEVAIIMEM